MPDCTRCGDGMNMPYSCKYCGREFCTSHRRPEDHACPNLKRARAPSTADRSTTNIRQTAEQLDAETSIWKRIFAWKWTIFVVVVVLAVGALAIGLL
ncbi:AN1-type zinc finger domain-containing protein [Halostagnicola bangensis]